jgi:hypothetical protein
LSRSLVILLLLAGIAAAAWREEHEITELLAISRLAGDVTTTYNPALDPRARSYFNASEFSGYTNGQLIAQWTDLSTNGRNAVQSVDTNKPFFDGGWLNFSNGAASGRWLLWDSGDQMTNGHTLFALLSHDYALAQTGLNHFVTIRVSASNNIGAITLNGNASVIWANEHFTFFGQESGGALSGVAYTSTTANIISAGSAVWTFLAEPPQSGHVTNLFVRYNNAEPPSPLGKQQPAIGSARTPQKYQRIGGQHNVPTTYKIKIWLLFDQYLNDDDQTQVYNWMSTQ